MPQFGYVQDFPHADASYLPSISLPIYPDLSEAQCERLVQSVMQVAKKNRNLTMVPVHFPDTVAAQLGD